MKKAVDELTRLINKMEADSKTFYEDLLTKMVLQKIRDDEVLKI